MALVPKSLPVLRWQLVPVLGELRKGFDVPEAICGQVLPLPASALLMGFPRVGPRHCQVQYPQDMWQILGLGEESRKSHPAPETARYWNARHGYEEMIAG